LILELLNCNGLIREWTRRLQDRQSVAGCRSPGTPVARAAVEVLRGYSCGFVEMGVDVRVPVVRGRGML